MRPHLVVLAHGKAIKDTAIALCFFTRRKLLFSPFELDGEMEVVVLIDGTEIAELFAQNVDHLVFNFEDSLGIVALTLRAQKCVPAIEVSAVKEFDSIALCRGRHRDPTPGESGCGNAVSRRPDECAPRNVHGFSPFTG